MVGRWLHPAGLAVLNFRKRLHYLIETPPLSSSGCSRSLAFSPTRYIKRATLEEAQCIHDSSIKPNVSKSPPMALPLKHLYPCESSFDSREYQTVAESWVDRAEMV